MSTELATTGSSNPLAELMGDPKQSSEQRNALARINILSSAIRGEVELGGKKIKTDVVPVGAYKITLGDDVFYAESIEVRILTDRLQWQRWNSSTNEMEKSVMSRSVNNDLQDSVGGFNLGRPSGYIEDFNALPEATKDVIRTVKRVKIFMGTVTIKNPVDNTGSPISGEYVDIPFIMDVKNRDSLKSIDASQKAIARKNSLPHMTSITLTGEEAALPNGSTFGYISSSVGSIVEPSDDDNLYMQQTAADFLSYIQYSNAKIMDLHHDRSNESMDAEDAALVGSIIDVEEAPY